MQNEGFYFHGASVVGIPCGARDPPPCHCLFSCSCAQVSECGRRAPSRDLRPTTQGVQISLAPQQPVTQSGLLCSGFFPAGQLEAQGNRHHLWIVMLPLELSDGSDPFPSVWSLPLFSLGPCSPSQPRLPPRSSLSSREQLRLRSALRLLRPRPRLPSDVETLRSLLPNQCGRAALEKELKDRAEKVLSLNGGVES